MNDNLFDAVDSTPSPEAIASNVVEQANEASKDAKEAVITSAINELEHPQPSFIEPKADLIVGATGSGKTINIGEVAKYVLLKYHKLTRLASTDPSGPGPLDGDVKAGKIEFWAPQAWPKPIEAMWKSTKGYWPLRADDPESPLVPPDAGTFEVYGFGAFEGLTSYGDSILDDLKKNNVTLSQDPSYKWNQGEFTTAGGNQSYYGMMQDTLKLWVVNTHLLGYEKVLWTALESKGKDQFGNTVAGPMIGGKQATGKAGQWFVNFVHTDIVNGKETLDPKTNQKMIEVNYFLFLKPHVDPLTLIPFPTKVRVPKEFAKEVPFYIENGSLADAYVLLDKLHDKQMKQAIAEMDSIAGLRDRLLEKAIAARLKEKEAADKRAKAANLLKPMVTVPAMAAPATSGLIGAGPVAPKVAGPVSPAPVAPAGPLKPLGVPVIQNVRRGSK